MTILLTEWCNVFGVETGGAKRLLGGLSNSKAGIQWYCPTRSIGRFRMTCEHGHTGQVMPLCLSHWFQYRQGVSFCPRCNIPPDDHRCKLTLTEVS